MAKVATKTRVTKKQVIAHRTRAVKDHSPVWEGCESWDADTFHKHFRTSMNYYRLESDIKTYKPAVAKWMETVGCTKADITAFKKVKDARVGTTMGAVACCLNRGMTAQRADFNQGRDTAAWLRAEIVKVIAEGKNDIDPDEVKEVKNSILAFEYLQKSFKFNLNSIKRLYYILTNDLFRPGNIPYPKGFKKEENIVGDSTVLPVRPQPQ